MDLKRYVVGQDLDVAVHVLASAFEDADGRALLKAIELRQAELTKQLLVNPVVVESGPVSEDFRVRIGELNALKWICELANDARVRVGKAG